MLTCETRIFFLIQNMVPGLDLCYTRWSGTYLVKHEKTCSFQSYLGGISFIFYDLLFEERIRVWTNERPHRYTGTQFNTVGIPT